MKPRKAPFERKTRLVAKTELQRRSELKRAPFRRGSAGAVISGGSTPPRNGPTKARKTARSKAEQDARDVVWGRASRETGRPLCEVCGRVPAKEYQHRKAKAHCSRAERWAPANGLAVCGHGNYAGCHGRIHQQPIEAEKNGWTVLSCQDPLLESVVRRGVRVWFDNEGGMSAEQGSAA